MYKAASSTVVNLKSISVSFSFVLYRIELLLSSTDVVCVRFVSFIGYLCLLVDEGKNALLALPLQRLDSSEEGKDVYFQQSSVL